MWILLLILSIISLGAGFVLWAGTFLNKEPNEETNSCCKNGTCQCNDESGKIEQ